MFSLPNGQFALFTSTTFVIYQNIFLPMQHSCFFSEIILMSSQTWQEKELAVAASKLAECQKTIASLGRQLKSLATLEDFLLDSEKPQQQQPMSERLHHPKDDPEQRTLHTGNLYIPKKDSESLKTEPDHYSSGIKKTKDEASTVPINPVVTMSSEKSRNGFGKFFPRSKNATRAEK